MQPLRELGEPILDFVGPSAYVEVQQVFDANLPRGQHYLSKAHNLESLSDGALDTMVQYLPNIVGEFTAAYFDPKGGRDTGFGFHCIAGWMNASNDDVVIGWASEFQDAMSAHATGDAYVNPIADDEAERVPSAYGENYERIVRLKEVWDPSNAFQSNYSVQPT